MKSTRSFFVTLLITLCTANPSPYNLTIRADDSPNCVTTCGGCTPGRCDVFGCKGGLYCCVGNVISPDYGACCSSCSGSPPITPPPTPSPAPCPPGMVTPHQWPWDHTPPVPCSKHSWVYKGCMKIANKLLNKHLLGKACSYGLKDFFEKCVGEEGMETIAEAAEFGGPAAAFLTTIGVGGSCLAQKFALKWVCGKFTGAITKEIAGRMEADVCQHIVSAFHSHWFEAGQRSSGGGRQPVGFPPIFEVTTKMVGTNSTTVSRIAYDATDGIMFQNETFPETSTTNFLSSKRFVAVASNGTSLPACTIYWNATGCHTATTQEQGIPQSANAAPLPGNYLDFLLQNTLNVSTPLMFIEERHDSVAQFAATSDSLPPGWSIYYYEQNINSSFSVPLHIDVIEDDTNTTLFSLVFDNLIPAIDHASWGLPSYCPVDLVGRCDMTCNNIGAWGLCANSSYGITANLTTTHGFCGVVFGFETSCPLQYPYCTSTHSCSTVPYQCVSGTTSYNCGEGYPCCDFGSGQCAQAPCTVSSPPARLNPAAIDFTNGGSGPPGPTPGPPPPPPPTTTATPSSVCPLGTDAIAFGFTTESACEQFGTQLAINGFTDGPPYSNCSTASAYCVTLLHGSPAAAVLTNAAGLQYVAFRQVTQATMEFPDAASCLNALPNAVSSCANLNCDGPVMQIFASDAGACNVCNAPGNWVDIILATAPVTSMSVVGC